MIGMVFGRVLEKDTKIDIDKKNNNAQFNNNILTVFQKGNKNNIQIKKVPVEVFNEIKEEDFINIVCDIYPWSQQGSNSADVSCSFKELYIPKVVSVK